MPYGWIIPFGVPVVMALVSFFYWDAGWASLCFLTPALITLFLLVPTTAPAKEEFEQRLREEWDAIIAKQVDILNQMSGKSEKERAPLWAMRDALEKDLKRIENNPSFKP